MRVIHLFTLWASLILGCTSMLSFLLMVCWFTSGYADFIVVLKTDERA